ncbi:MAG: hypothetical protein JOY54_00460 [Acidobacteriaceae bacterium]|nr:hypothetical protein [Acidobacteriaceae bacterium]
MSQSRPDDIGSLLSQVDLDQSHYRVFVAGSRNKTQPEPEAVLAVADKSAPEQFACADNLDSAGLILPDKPRVAIARATEPAVRIDRGRNRDWTGLDFFLKGPRRHAFNGPEAALQHRLPVPAISLLSLSGGVGVTSIVAALARVMALDGERPLLLDTTRSGLLPFFFGARGMRPQISTFVAPEGRGAAVHIASHEDAVAPEPADAWIWRAIAAVGSDTDLVIADIPAQSAGEDLKAFVRQTIPIVVLVPDVRCLVGLQSIETLLNGQETNVGKGLLPHLLLNAFESSNPLHLEIQDRIATRFKDRLIPVTIRRDPHVSDALAHGLTVLDHAPGSPVTEDLFRFAEWLRALFLTEPAVQPRRIR